MFEKKFKHPRRTPVCFYQNRETDYSNILLKSAAEMLLCSKVT